MYDGIEAAGLGDDPGDTGFDRSTGGDIEFDGAQIRAVLFGESGCIGDRFGIAAFGGAHAGVDDVAFPSKGAGSESAEAARCTGDDDNLLAHCPIPSFTR